MKNIKTLLTVTASACALASNAQAMIQIASSYVENPNNASDSSTGSLYGAVSYSYHIGTFEVTNNQYVSFLNAKDSTNAHGVYNTRMEDSPHGGIHQEGTSGSFTYSARSGMGNEPVNYVSFWDAARFTNWLTNGQGSGDTENGVYALTSGGISGNTITRNTGAGSAWANGGVGVSSENGCYEAAYYDPTLNNDTGGYWLYPTARKGVQFSSQTPALWAVALALFLDFSGRKTECSVTIKNR
jgi:hypothetical protein